MQEVADGVQGVAIGVGLVALPLVAWSEYTLKATGAFTSKHNQHLVNMIERSSCCYCLAYALPQACYYDVKVAIQVYSALNIPVQESFQGL